MLSQNYNKSYDVIGDSPINEYKNLDSDLEK